MSTFTLMLILIPIIIGASFGFYEKYQKTSSKNSLGIRISELLRDRSLEWDYSESFSEKKYTIYHKPTRMKLWICSGSVFVKLHPNGSDEDFNHYEKKIIWAAYKKWKKQRTEINRIKFRNRIHEILDSNSIKDIEYVNRNGVDG